MVRHNLEIATNILNGYVYADCSCGTWRRVWTPEYFPGLQDAESDHESHRQWAGAAELCAGIFDSFRLPTTLRTP